MHIDIRCLHGYLCGWWLSIARTINSYINVYNIWVGAKYIYFSLSSILYIKCTYTCLHAYPLALESQDPNMEGNDVSLILSFTIHISSWLTTIPSI